ncbi:MAG: hypothetical protein ACM3JI_01195 [Anaerolineae bacterium]
MAKKISKASSKKTSSKIAKPSSSLKGKMKKGGTGGGSCGPC